jgi:hypothetical protein
MSHHHWHGGAGRDHGRHAVARRLLSGLPHMPRETCPISRSPGEVHLKLGINELDIDAEPLPHRGDRDGGALVVLRRGIGKPDVERLLRAVACLGHELDRRGIAVGSLFASAVITARICLRELIGKRDDPADCARPGGRRPARCRCRANAPRDRCRTATESAAC